MTDRERIETELDRGPWDQFHVLADLSLDEGNETLAAGYRWLAVNYKWPLYNAQAKRWQWQRKFSDTELSCVLPTRLLVRKDAATIVLLPTGICRYRFATLSQALRYAAETMGRFLASVNP